MNEKVRNILVFVLIAFLLCTTVFVSGCTDSVSSTLKSDEEVGKAVEDISTDITDLGSALDELDETLG